MPPNRKLTCDWCGTANAPEDTGLIRVELPHEASGASYICISCSALLGAAMQEYDGPESEQDALVAFHSLRLRMRGDPD